MIDIIHTYNTSCPKCIFDHRDYLYRGIVEIDRKYFEADSKGEWSNPLIINQEKLRELRKEIRYLRATHFKEYSCMIKNQKDPNGNSHQDGSLPTT